MPGEATPENLDVFLNVPFDKKQEPVFVGMVIGLVTVGLRPRCVIEIAETGEGRMDRLFNLLASSFASIHDISRVDGARFNMPFELGIAYALKRQLGRHKWVVFEEKKYRIKKTLSDLDFIDARVHEGKGPKAIACIHQVFHVKGEVPDLAAATAIYRSIMHHHLPKLRHGEATIFTRLGFIKLVTEVVGMSGAPSKEPGTTRAQKAKRIQ